MLRVVNLWKKLNWHTQEDQSPGWRDWHEAVGEKQGVDSRDEVRHSEKNDQLFVKTMMKADRKEWSQMRSECCSEAEQ